LRSPHNPDAIEKIAINLCRQSGYELAGVTY